MKSSEKIGLILLAAGGSNRLGQPKQLIKYHEKPLLQHMIDSAQEVDVSEQVLVLGAKGELIQEVVETGSFQVVHNYDWQNGMASSIHLGLRSLESKNFNLKHVIIMLSDQPFLSPEILQQLIASQDPDQPCITACSYANQLGVPAIFSHHFFDDLLALDGDQGAKRLIQEHLSHVRTIPFSKGAIDIDTPEDLDHLT